MNFKIDSITNMILSSPKQPERVGRSRRRKEVTEEEFRKFINEYPNPLEQDFFMDWYSYNDFSKGKWPESMVAKEFHMYDIDKYEIYTDEIEEVKIPASKNWTYIINNLKED